MTREDRLPINDEIATPRVQVMADEGLLGSFLIGSALELAAARGLDLIQVYRVNAKSSICRLADSSTFDHAKHL